LKRNINWTVEYNNEKLIFQYLCSALVYIKNVGGDLLIKKRKKYIQGELF
jgi:hypothetical protein